MVSQLNLSFLTCFFLTLMFCGTDQLPLPQKTLVPFLHLYSPRAAHEPQERKEAALQRVMHMLCLTPTSLSMLSSYLSQTEHFLQPVFTSSSEQEKVGQLLSQPSSPRTAALPFPAESLLWPYTHKTRSERQHGKVPIALALGEREMHSVCESEDF